MVTRWLGTWPTSRVKTCTPFIGYFALAGRPAIVEPPLRAAYRRGGVTPPWRGKLAATYAGAGLKPGSTGFCRTPSGVSTAAAHAMYGRTAFGPGQRRWALHLWLQLHRPAGAHVWFSFLARFIDDNIAWTWRAHRRYPSLFSTGRSSPNYDTENGRQHASLFLGKRRCGHIAQRQSRNQTVPRPSWPCPLTGWKSVPQKLRVPRSCLEIVVRARPRFPLCRSRAAGTGTKSEQKCFHAAILSAVLRSHRRDNQVAKTRRSPLC